MTIMQLAYIVDSGNGISSQSLFINAVGMVALLTAPYIMYEPVYYLKSLVMNVQ